jgi:hypothetical protein
VNNIDIAKQHASVDEQASEPTRQAAPHGERPTLLSQASATIGECPLHTAVRQLARAAVTQHVFYAEGEYAPRPDLTEEMHAWLRIHDLVRASVCPASRAANLTPAEIELAVLGASACAPEELRAELRTALLACGARTRGEGCPAEREPAKALFD